MLPSHTAVEQYVHENNKTSLISTQSGLLSPSPCRRMCMFRRPLLIFWYANSEMCTHHLFLFNYYKNLLLNNVLEIKCVPSLKLLFKIILL